MKLHNKQILTIKISLYDSIALYKFDYELKVLLQRGLVKIFAFV